MDLASVSSIGGGAVAFFPPPSYPFSHIPSRSASRADVKLSQQDLLNKCETQARRVRARGSDIYGALDGESRRGALFCRSGTWLEILDEYSAAQQTPRGERPETVRGAATKNTRYGLLDFVSVAIGLVSIRGVEANRYMCMNKDGLLYSAPFSNFSAECVFLEEMMENYYNVYSSCVHGSRRRPWYVALRRTGRPRVGRKTRKKRKASHFLVVHYDEPQPRSGDDFSLAELLVPSLKHQPPQNPYFRRTVPAPRPPAPRRKEVFVPLDVQQQQQLQRRNKKKRRRQQRLQTEEAQRRRRKEELDGLRAREDLPSHMDNRVAPTPRLSGAGLQIRPRRVPYP